MSVVPMFFACEICARNMSKKYVCGMCTKYLHDLLACAIAVRDVYE